MAKRPPAWGRFGGEVRRLRRHAGISQQQLARAITLSQSMLSGIELGTKGAKLDHARAIDRALNTEGKLVRLWDSLNANDSYPNWFQEVVTLERRAVEIREYQLAVLPGLTQTESYASALIGPAQPFARAGAVERLVQARIRRADLLAAHDRPLVWFVVDEIVIQRPQGGPEVLKPQLEHLLKLISEKAIRLQVVPDSRTAHPGLAGPIRLMSFDDRPTMVYTEHALGGVLSDQEDAVRHCSAIFSALQAEALSPSESARLIRSRKDEL